jgi:hypothetical protein
MAGDDPYVRTADGQVMGLPLRTATGQLVLNGALMPWADAAIVQHIRGVRPAVRDCQECHLGPAVDEVKPVSHQVWSDGASYFLCEEHAQSYELATRYDPDRSAAIEWSADDRRAAIREGWDIFETDDDERPFRLQRVEDRTDAWFEQPERVWDSDQAVWQHVFSRAAGGSGLHTRALDFLAAHSPAERAEISRYVDAAGGEAERHRLRLDRHAGTDRGHEQGPGVEID